MRTASAHAPGRRPRRSIAALLLPAAAVLACNSAAPAKSAESASVPAAAGAAPTIATAAAAAAPTLVVYKTPTCGCCKAWVSAMQDAGFTVEVHDVADLAPVKHAAGVPSELEACHTARIGGYVVEGHVPAADIRRLLAERPDVAGIATPGMPVGSPGMEGPYKDRYDVMTFGTDGRTTVFASH
jgi:hypothetical protein